MQRVSYGMIGEKVGMTRVFTEKGLSQPVTVLKMGPCYVVQNKSVEKDGYRAVQIGYQEIPEKKSTKPRTGHAKKHQAPVLKHIKEYTFPEDQSFPPGQVIKVDGFTVGDRVHVTGRSRGKGFAGVVKRYGFHGGPKTHGSTHYRAPGSIGATDAGRVFKGKKLPGRMGFETVTVKNLEVVGVNGERDLLLIKGAVPGSPGTPVYVRKLGQ